MKKRGRRRRELERIGSRGSLKEREREGGRAGKSIAGAMGHVANRTRILNNGY